MDQQSMDAKADVPSGGNFNGNSSSTEQRVGGNGYHSRNQNQKKQQSLVGNYMSEEELKIRGELENNIERDLEEEIKDGIYHLARRLHRLYQHQKERNARQVIESSGHPDHHSKKKKKNKTLCEVNINIRMEGGTKIEIKETKKELEDPDKGRSWTSSRSENMQSIMQVSNQKKFDWANSLRSGADPGSIDKRKTGVSHPNSNIETGRRNLISALGQRKGSSSVDNNKVLELGWKR